MPDYLADLKGIREYLSQYYESTVRNFIGKLRKKVAGLKEHPYLWPVFQDDPDYRRMVVGSYLIFYIVREDTKTVEIHRIFHGSRDVARHLK
jgi:plasmid stabilization system protein ParE